MTNITLQVINGLEKGRVFSDLLPPVTIGREEDNQVQLNDERVSRFHLKIQEESGRIILIDLDSTNGTRVNGHPVQMRVLQIGDQLSIGRSLLLFGSAEEIGERTRRLQGQKPVERESLTVASQVAMPDEDAAAANVMDELEELFPDGPPILPEALRPVQAAQVSDILAFAHEQIARVIDAAREEEHDGQRESCVDWAHWQRLLKLEMQLAKYLQQISNPHG